MRTGAAIEAVGLTKEYRSRGRTVRAVDGLNLSVGAGEFFSLLGVNGAGKTTVIKMLSCLTPPTAGTATPRTGGGAAADECFTAEYGGRTKPDRRRKPCLHGRAVGGGYRRGAPRGRGYHATHGACSPPA